MKKRTKTKTKTKTQPVVIRNYRDVTIQASPPSIRIYEHCVFFLAFVKAKNAHIGVGSPIRPNVCQ